MKVINESGQREWSDTVVREDGQMEWEEMVVRQSDHWPDRCDLCL